MSVIEDDGVSIEVLLVEDSPGDIRLTQEAFQDANSAIKFQVTEQDDSLKTIPTIILTTSGAEVDMAKCFEFQTELLPHQTGAVGRVREPREKHQ